MPVPATAPGHTADLHASLLAELPRIRAHARYAFQHVACPDTREDLVAETVAIGWKYFAALSHRGKDPTGFITTLSLRASQAVRAGRGLVRSDNARDALSPVCQRRRNFVVAPLPDGTAMVGNVFDEALTDNTRTPVPDQVQFRLDFPRWRRSLGRRRRALADAMAAGHRTTELAGMFHLSRGRVSQVRRELCASWRTFCGDDPS
jgi:hypothetical protein